LAKTIELRLVWPNALLLKPAPAVKLLPLLNVIPLASTAVNLCAALVKVIEPLMLPVVPVGKLIVSVLVPLMFSWEPDATDKSSPVSPPIVRVVPVAAG
jgi:hypothetical protein